jgi:hypothetical protein
VSEERDLKAGEEEEPVIEQDVEAHKKPHGGFTADSTANDDGDDVEAHVKRHNV